MKPGSAQGAGAPRQDRREEYRAYHQRNKARRNADSLRRYHANKARELERHEHWVEANKERAKASWAAYRKKHRQERIEYCRRYRLRNKKRRDPVASAKRLSLAAAQIAKHGYVGKLTPGGI